MSDEFHWRPGTDPPQHEKPVLAWCGGKLTGYSCVAWYDMDDREWGYVADVWDELTPLSDPDVTWWAEIPNPWGAEAVRRGEG